MQDRYPPQRPGPGRHGPLPLPEVFAIVERHRRRRARVKAVAAPVVAVGAAGLAGVVVVALQTGGAEVEPAAAPPPPASLVTAQPEPTGIDPARPADPPPFAPDELRPEFLGEVADSFLELPTEEQRSRVGRQALAIEEAWGLEFHPEAKAVAVKAELTGTPLVVSADSGAQALVNGFERAGYTDEDAAELAAAWGTDERAARIIGVLVAEAR
jgi:hypothetical protein